MHPSMNLSTEIPDATGLMVHKHHFNTLFKHLFLRAGWLSKQFIARYLPKVKKSSSPTTTLFLKTTMAHSAR